MFPQIENRMLSFSNLDCKTVTDHAVVLVPVTVDVVVGHPYASQNKKILLIFCYFRDDYFFPFKFI